MVVYHHHRLDMLCPVFHLAYPFRPVPPYQRDDQDRMMGRERTAALGDEVRVLDIALVGCIYECIDTVVHILLDRVVYGTLAA